ncbi:MAG: HAD family hydrolase [Acidimicrobiales bacterium]|nr:HAD family hydrolase [Acidimicrobiales bacterium]
MPDLVAVTFDFWDTLLQAPDAAVVRAIRAERLLAALSLAGLDVDPSAVLGALGEVVKEFNRRWGANEQYTYLDAVEFVVHRIGVTLTPELHERLVTAFCGKELPQLPPLAPNVVDTLIYLRAKGIRIGIICDVGLSPSMVLRSHLDRHGILDLFDHWSFSDEVGCYKPDPRIFEHAAAGLGVVPEQAAHVGDLRRTDIAGARSSGWFAVRYCGIHDDHDENAGPEGDAVVRDHADLPDVLGLG